MTLVHLGGYIGHAMASDTTRDVMPRHCSEAAAQRRYISPMRQTRWAVPGRETRAFEYCAGALQVLVVDGRTLLAGMYCAEEGYQRVDLRDASTGEVVDVHGLGDKEWWHDPAEHFTGFTWQGSTFVLHITGRPRGCRVLRVTRDGFESVGHVVPGPADDDSFIDAVAPADLDGQLAILTCEFDNPSRTATFRDGIGHDDRTLGSWSVPEGWKCFRLVTTGERSYAWLEFHVPEETPPEERWRVADTYGRWLWDVTSGVPVGAPLLVRGFDRGVWGLNGRPVALFEVRGRRDCQVWDLARREPLGPGLGGDLGLSHPQVGLVHGRAVLAGTAQDSLRVRDIGTGRLLGTTDLPDAPIATAIGPDGTVWAITRTGYVGSLTVSPAQVHPSTVRRQGRAPSGDTAMR